MRVDVCGMHSVWLQLLRWTVHGYNCWDFSVPPHSASHQQQPGFNIKTCILEWSPRRLCGWGSQPLFIGHFLSAAVSGISARGSTLNSPQSLPNDLPSPGNLLCGGHGYGRGGGSTWLLSSTEACTSEMFNDGVWPVWHCESEWTLPTVSLRDGPLSIADLTGSSCVECSPS